MRMPSLLLAVAATAALGALGVREYRRSQVKERMMQARTTATRLEKATFAAG
jgi:hypothetical protein